MDSDESAPEDVPISSQPLDELFSKRLTAKKIQREKKNLHTLIHQKKTSSKLTPLPQDIIDSLSQTIPQADIPEVKKEQKIGKRNQGNRSKNTKPELYEEESNKLLDFIPLEDINKKCATKFKVGILNSIVKNPANKNYKEYVLYQSKHARETRKSNVKTDFVKKALMKRILRS